ncbi:hypothetical protein KKE60_05815, partial [Patescibacteria group bacterium]|nr:hypothetical protein [Patescibacteria group bacterium]
HNPVTIPVTLTAKENQSMSSKKENRRERRKQQRTRWEINDEGTITKGDWCCDEMEDAVKDGTLIVLNIEEDDDSDEDYPVFAIPVVKPTRSKEGRAVEIVYCPFCGDLIPDMDWA